MSFLELLDTNIDEIKIKSCTPTPKKKKEKEDLDWKGERRIRHFHATALGVEVCTGRAVEF